MITRKLWYYESDQFTKSAAAERESLKFDYRKDTISLDKVKLRERIQKFCRSLRDYKLGEIKVHVEGRENLLYI